MAMSSSAPLKSGCSSSRPAGSPVSTATARSALAFISRLSAARASTAATTSTVPELAQQRTEIVETINDAITDLEPKNLDAASQDELEALEALARQLTGEPNLARAAHQVENDEALKKVSRFQQELEAEDSRQAIDIIQQLRVVNAATLEVVKKARADGKDSTLLRAVDRIHKQIELQARLLGEIQEAQTTVNVAVLPEWHGIRQVVIEALHPYPEARLAVVRALKGD